MYSLGITEKCTMSEFLASFCVLKTVRSSELPGALPPGLPPGLCPGPAGGLTAPPIPPAEILKLGNQLNFGLDLPLTGNSRKIQVLPAQTGDC